MFLDEEIIKKLQSTKFMTKFNIPSKLMEYSQNENANVEARENVIVFQKWDDDSFTMEDYRLIMFYGFTAMQYFSNNERTIINLKSFPEGSANWDRSVLITFVKTEHDYLVTTTITTSGDLTDLDQIYFGRTKSITLPFIRETLTNVKDELYGNCYELLADHLNALEVIFSENEIQQLKLKEFTDN